MVLGELSRGKLSSIVVRHRWAEEYRHDPKRPIPFRIELRDFSRQFDARGLLHQFLDKNRLGHIPVDFVFSLIRSGRVVLMLDGYDEMAQYMNSRERRACLEALAELAADGARGILTSRPNFFSEAEELQVFELLYSSIKDRGYLLSRVEGEVIEHERRIDDLITTYLLNKTERVLQDLSAEQTENLVRRALRNDTVGQESVLRVLRQVSRTTDEGARVSLSGKPVIIGYLLDVVESLKSDAPPDRALSEWEIFRLIVDRLMLRDWGRSNLLLPDVRRKFLQRLALRLSERGRPSVGEDEFRDLIRDHFSSELRRRLPETVEDEVETLFADLRSSATLTRSLEPNRTGWRFSHNSLREYLLVECLLDDLVTGAGPGAGVPITEPMRIFATTMPTSRADEAIAKLTEAWATRAGFSTIGQLLLLLWPTLLRKYIGSNDPIGEALAAATGTPPSVGRIALDGIEFYIEKIPPAMLDHADFSESSLTRIDFRFAKLFGANFSHALLDAVDASNADLREAVFDNSVIAGLVRFDPPCPTQASALA